MSLVGYRVIQSEVRGIVVVNLAWISGPQGGLLGCWDAGVSGGVRGGWSLQGESSVGVCEHRGQWPDGVGFVVVEDDHVFGDE